VVKELARFIIKELEAEELPGLPGDAQHAKPPGHCCHGDAARPVRSLINWPKATRTMLDVRKAGSDQIEQSLQAAEFFNKTLLEPLLQQLQSRKLRPAERLGVSQSANCAVISD